MLVYLNGQFLPKEQAHLSPDDRGFLFGDGVYEVVRSFDGHLFQANAHWQRMRTSLAATEINGPTATELQHIAETLLQKNGLHRGEATVYLQVTRGVAPRRHGFPRPLPPPTVYACSAAFTPPREKWDSGIRVITVPDTRWLRCDIKAISLLANILANEQAQSAGAHEALLVRDGVITEGSHTNFAAVRDGSLVTHPTNSFILNGITRGVVLDLCAGLNIPVSEVGIRAVELPLLNEAMLLGTTNDIMPIVQINDQIIGGGRPGPVTRQLQKAFQEFVEGV
jgi:D-alanine transaminase